MRTITISLIAVLIASSELGAFAGSGTEADPYLITTVAEFSTFLANAKSYGNAHFKLTLDLAYPQTYPAPFDGVFDGDNHTIYGVNVLKGDSTGTGVFSTLRGTVKNLHLAGVNFNLRIWPIGALAGYNEGTIINCSMQGSVIGLAYTGGLVGINKGTIQNCHSEGKVTGLYDYSGILGGLVGENYGIIVDSYSSCSINGSNYIGGLAGRCSGGTIRDCYSEGSVKGTMYVGGLVGYVISTTKYPQATVIENCYASGNVAGNERVGGFAGENGSSIIRNCYAVGDVAGAISVIGGFAANVHFYADKGFGTPMIDKCYSTGKVTGPTELGGFLARRLGNSQVTNCYWNMQTSGLTVSQGGIGKTNAQMLMQSTFAGWNFSSIWRMVGYPVLRWEMSPLQERIDTAVNGDLIAVSPGVYVGRIYFDGKNVNLFANDPATAILRGRCLGPVVTFKGTENETCALDGFTIEGGNAMFPGGGGIYGGPTGNALAAVRNCIIQNNRTTDYGGAIGGLKGQISNCIIRNNAAKYGGALGWCNGIIKNCLIKNNSASSAGHAISNCDGQVLNCTLVSNQSRISQVSSCKANFASCILYCQTKDFENCTGTVSYSRYPSAQSADCTRLDPMFADPNSEDYRLQPISPCRNTGDIAYVPDPNETDLDGNRRIVGGCIDMGAFEFPNTIPIAEANDITAYAWVDGLAMVWLNGTGSRDEDGDTLTYNWYNDANELIATGAEPNIVFGIGEYDITLVVNDGIDDSEPNFCKVTVIAPVQVSAKVMAAAINPRGFRPQVRARLAFAEEPAIDPAQPMLLLAGDLEIACASPVLEYSTEDAKWYLTGQFDCTAMNSLPAGDTQITLVSKFASGQWVFGSDTIKIIKK